MFGGKEAVATGVDTPRLSSPSLHGVILSYSCDSPPRPCPCPPLPVPVPTEISGPRGGEIVPGIVWGRRGRKR